MKKYESATTKGFSPSQEYQILKTVDLATQYHRIAESLRINFEETFARTDFIGGKFVSALEQSLATRVGAKYCVSCASGTDALVLALRVVGVKSGDIVLCPSYTFAATAEAVLLAGGTPEFVDIDSETLNLCPVAVSRRLNAPSMPRPRGILAVDIFGQPADYISLREIANTHGLWLVADAAQSVGAVSCTGPVGTLADITTTSFYPAKPLGCYGDGGAIFTEVEEYAIRIKSLRDHGQGDTRYQHVEVGMCSRLDTLQAAVLLAKLDIFDDELERRNHVAEVYSHQLQKFVLPPVMHATVVRSSWAQYTIRLRRENAESIADLKSKRTRVLQQLTSKGIPARTYYSPALHEQRPYASYVTNCLHNTDIVSADSISLPMHPYLTEDEIMYITKHVAQVVQHI